ncbi:MAG TPA: response regulator [Actinomycetota bacterium]|jgi:CheY-like chemotaxis protein|nr:response regulator [Actinomycetota bacterium]
MADPDVATDDDQRQDPPILLVEDDESQALLVERVLRKAKLANPLLALRNGEEALAYLEGLGRYGDRSRYPLPALVLLDVHIPGKSGLEILTWLREHRSLDHIPAVMLSGSAESEDIDRAFELGAASYLVKPVAFDALLDTVGGLGLSWVILGKSPGSANGH